jgi:hypothetical protein
MAKGGAAKQQPVNVHTAKRVLDIPDAFWLEFVHRYPTAGMLLLSPTRANWPLADVKLTDTSYSYIELPVGLLINYLPKNLSENEHLNFHEGDGVFEQPDSTGAGDDAPSEWTKWEEPSALFAQTYPKFYGMLDDWKTKHLLIIRNDLKRKMYAELVRDGN